jgi:hypothetical protein
MKASVHSRAFWTVAPDPAGSGAVFTYAWLDMALQSSLSEVLAISWVLMILR